MSIVIPTILTYVPVQLYLPLVDGNSKTRPNILVENCVKEDQKRSVDIVDSNGPILESTA